MAHLSGLGHRVGWKEVRPTRSHAIIALAVGGSVVEIPAITATSTRARPPLAWRRASPGFAVWPSRAGGSCWAIPGRTGSGRRDAAWAGRCLRDICGHRADARHELRSERQLTGSRSTSGSGDSGERRCSTCARTIRSPSGWCYEGRGGHSARRTRRPGSRRCLARSAGRWTSRRTSSWSTTSPPTERWRSPAATRVAW